MDRRRGRALLASRALRFDASPECIHKIDDLGWLVLARCFNLNALLLFLQQLLHRAFVLVLKFLRIEIACFCIDDVLLRGSASPSF